MSGGSSQCILDELARLGEDGVLAELCDVLKQSGCSWLEDEIPTGYINRDQLCRRPEKETQENGPKRGPVDTIPSMHQLRGRGDNRGSRTGDGSLQQLWYDPSFPVAGECFHEHDIRSTEKWAMHKDPLLFSCSIFPIHLDGYASINKSTNLKRGAARFASCLRWNKLSERRRRRQADKKVGNGISVS